MSSKTIRIIDAVGKTNRYHVIVSGDDQIGSLSGGDHFGRRARVYASPTPTSRFEPRPLQEVSDRTFHEFGLVSGSTLIIDHRPAAAAASGSNLTLGARV